MPKKQTITAKEKYKAIRVSPARCSECDKLSSVSGNIEGLFIIILNIGFYLSLFIAFYYWSWTPIILMVILAVSAEYLIYKYAPLKEISEKEVRKINYLYNFGLAAVLIMVIYTVINNV